MAPTHDPQWHALSEALDRALELAEHELGPWLTALAARDALTAARVARALALRGHRGFADFLTGHAPAPAVTAVTLQGLQIGPYILEEEVGRGGMALVWRARRADGLLNRPIALKLPTMGLVNREQPSRFARERDILAKLSHPHIAHLYDAGITPDGQPYLAMQFVVGDAITSYCDRHGLAVSARLDLFLQVLAAVHYAHGQGVIHRDLKPSNILVTEAAQVVLLDFGIAKLLVSGDAGDADLTRAGGAALTPSYASPEQINGEPLGPASDVYSLGVVLYELLSGARPYAVAGNSRRALEEAILSSDPRPPSKVAPPSAAERSRATRGDLDTIVLKALRKDPAERYADAGAFALDLRRYLRGEPVSARPASFWYRTRKFLRRQRAAFLGAAIAAVVVSGVLIGGSVLWSASHRSFAPPRNSIAVLPFVNLSGDPKQEYLADGISEELLNALTNVSQLQVAARWSSFSFKGRNLDIPTIASRLNVRAIVEGSVRREGATVRITAQLVDAATGYHLWSQTFDRSLTDILNVQTEVATQVAQRLQVRLIGNEAARIQAGGTTVAAAYDAYLRGMQLYYRQNTGEAGYRGALAEFNLATTLDPRFALAFTRKVATLLRIYMIGTDPAARKALQSEARAAAERAVELAPGLGESHLAMAMSHDIGVEDRTEAGREYERAHALSPGSAWVQMNYGLFASLSGHYDAAVPAARRAVALDPQNIDARKALGVILTGARRHEEAIAVLVEARVLQRGSHFIEYYIADNLLASGKYEAARQHCEPASTALDADGRHDCLAIAYHALGRQADADRELEAFEHEDGDSAAYRYARIYAQWGQRAQALQWLEKAEQLSDPDLSLLKADWHFDAVRDDPAFEAIEARMNYQQ